MIPGRGLLRLLAALVVLALAGSLWRGFDVLLYATALGGLGMTVAALRELWHPPRLEVVRQVEGQLPVGVWTEVKLELQSTDARTLTGEIFDHYPTDAELEGQPRDFALSPESHLEMTYRMRPLARGDRTFAPAEIWLQSRFDWLRRRHRVGEETAVRVLPDFRPTLVRGLAGLEARMARLGVHLQRRRGEGMDFQHLRDYRRGDSLRHVDWKATARHSRLIARQYQEERDQQVILWIDRSRRMRAREGDLTHFDHVLDACLLLAYVASRQGDAVGVQVFGQGRWLPPQRGRSAPQRVLDRIYDLETTTDLPDYPAETERLLRLQRRRALILLLTNLRDEDEGELRPTLERISRRHLVLLASTRETSLARLRDQPVTGFEQALEVAAAHHYLEARRRAHEAALGSGAMVLDVEPRQLPWNLAARYLEIKRAGAL